MFYFIFLINKWFTFKNISSSANITKLILFIFISGVLLFPILHINYSITPYRMGPDVPLYIESARFLIDGGTLSLVKTIPSDIFSLCSAKNHVNYLLYMRLGFPMVVAYVEKLIFSVHPYQISFWLLSFNYIGVGVLGHYLLFTIFKVPKIISLITSIALLFNANLLNNYYER